MVTKIKKIGGSVGLVIPKAVAAEMRFVSGTAVEVTASPEGMIVKRPGRRPRRPIKDVIKGMKRSNYTKAVHAQLDGPPVGREFW